VPVRPSKKKSTKAAFKPNAIAPVLGDGIGQNHRWLQWSNDEYRKLIDLARFETDVNRQNT